MDATSDQSPNNQLHIRFKGRRDNLCDLGLSKEEKARFSHLYDTRDSAPPPTPPTIVHQMGFSTGEEPPIASPVESNTLKFATTNTEEMKSSVECGRSRGLTLDQSNTGNMSLDRMKTAATTFTTQTGKSSLKAWRTITNNSIAESAMSITKTGTRWTKNLMLYGPIPYDYNDNAKVVWKKPDWVTFVWDFDPFKYDRDGDDMPLVSVDDKHTDIPNDIEAELCMRLKASSENGALPPSGGVRTPLPYMEVGPKDDEDFPEVEHGKIEAIVPWDAKLKEQLSKLGNKTLDKWLTKTVRKPKMKCDGCKEAKALRKERKKREKKDFKKAAKEATKAFSTFTSAGAGLDIIELETLPKRQTGTTTKEAKGKEVCTSGVPFTIQELPDEEKQFPRSSTLDWHIANDDGIAGPSKAFERHQTAPNEVARKKELITNRVVGPKAVELEVAEPEVIGPELAGSSREYQGHLGWESASTQSSGPSSVFDTEINAEDSFNSSDTTILKSNSFAVQGATSKPESEGRAMTPVEDGSQVPESQIEPFELGESVCV